LGDDLFASYTDLFDDVATQMRLFSGILILRRNECGGLAAVVREHAGATSAITNVHNDCAIFPAALSSSVPLEGF
jgi:hypothetical protein